MTMPCPSCGSSGVEVEPVNTGDEVEGEDDEPVELSEAERAQLEDEGYLPGKVSHAVQCDGCGAMGPAERTETDAIGAWNRAGGRKG